MLQKNSLFSLTVYKPNVIQLYFIVNLSDSEQVTVPLALWHLVFDRFSWKWIFIVLLFELASREVSSTDISSGKLCMWHLLFEHWTGFSAPVSAAASLIYAPNLLCFIFVQFDNNIFIFVNIRLPIDSVRKNPLRAKIFVPRTNSHRAVRMQRFTLHVLLSLPVTSL